MFLTIQDGAYTINIHAIAEIEWAKDSADVTLVTGATYTFEGEDFERLVKLVWNKAV